MASVATLAALWASSICCWTTLWTWGAGGQTGGWAGERMGVGGVWVPNRVCVCVRVCVRVCVCVCVCFEEHTENKAHSPPVCVRLCMCDIAGHQENRPSTEDGSNTVRRG